MTRGYTVVEALFSLLLLALLLQSGWAVLATQRDAAAWGAARAEGLETVRTVAWLLSEELSGGRSGVDWGEVAPDSLSLRAFRGLGMVLPGSLDQERMVVCFRGIRSPDPKKDSVLLLTATGGWLAEGLVDRRRLATPCRGTGTGWEEEWTLSSPPPSAVLARVFERGSYHLADGAFRYRRGLGGRQPLTPERISVGEFVLAPGPDAALSWSLTLSHPSGSGEPLPWVGGGG